MLLYCSASAATPSVWRRASDPAVSQAAGLLRVAERARLLSTLANPLDRLPDPSLKELREKLNELTVGLLSASHSIELQDPRLKYLLGDALLHAGPVYLDRAPAVLRQALHDDPDSPLAARAWFGLAIAEGKLGHHRAEQHAYTKALELEWQSERRATLLLNRAESAMAAEDLQAALIDYRASIDVTRSLKTRALAQWGLAVASDRSGNLRLGLELARVASGFRFGPPEHASSAIDLPGLFFLPEFEIHYYRALASMAEAESAASPAQALGHLQTAQFLWTQFLNAARPDHSPWIERAIAHRRSCRTQARAHSALSLTK